MSIPMIPTSRCCARALRTSPRVPFASQTPISQYQRRTPPCRRHESTTTAPPNPKITNIVDQISQLTLLETADLVSNLKVRSTIHPLSLPISLNPSSTFQTPNNPPLVKTQHPRPALRRLLTRPHHRRNSTPRRRRRSRARRARENPFHTDIEIIRRGCETENY